MTLLITQMIIAVITDVYCYKVKNLMIITFLVIETIFYAISIGENSFLVGLLGLAAPFILLFPLYTFKMLGAGDIKLFCSIGFLLGIKDVLYSIAYSYLFGFLIAVIIMIIRDNFITRLKNLLIYLKSCILSMCILPYGGLDVRSDGRMHFTIPIAMGTIAVMIF
jgi:prepilin peptidase CpaA